MTGPEFPRRAGASCSSAALASTRRVSPEPVSASPSFATWPRSTPGRST